jgi:hypothetical protein
MAASLPSESISIGTMTVPPGDVITDTTRTTLLVTGVAVAVGVAVGVFVGVAVGVAVGVFVGVEVTVGVAVGVFVGVAVGVAVGVFVGVAVGVAVGVFVGVAVGVAVGVLVGVAVGVLVGVGVGPPAVIVKLVSEMSKKIFPTASTLILAVEVVTLGMVTFSVPSLAVDARSTTGKVLPPSVDNDTLTFAALTGAAVVFATLHVTVCEEFPA